VNIVYGGAFDPPHAGHVDAARRALERFPAATLTVMPSPAPAVAGSSSAKAPSASFEDRVAMTRLAFAPLPRARVSRLEAELPAPNYTVNTLRALAADGEPLGLLIGGDQVESFTRWRDWQEILKLATVVAIGRNGPPPTAPFPVVAIEGWPPPAQSRVVRAAVAAKTDVAAGWLDPAVAAYIREKQLYVSHEVT
jgi:nicotinate-nucleotide adenylyltransferase